jgi:hypothetical protein
LIRRRRSSSDQCAECGKELAGEFLRGGIDQPLAELRELAADLRVDLVMQDRDLRTFGFQTHRRAALGKSCDAAGSLARDAIAVRRIEVGQRDLAAERRLDRADLDTTVAVISVGEDISSF